MHVSHGRSGQPSEQRTATFTGTVHMDPVIWAEPGEEHWHGACGDSLLTHMAVSHGTTEWAGEVGGERLRRRATMSEQYEVLAVRYGTRQASAAEVFLNYHAYREPDRPLVMDYFFWVARNPARTVVIDTGFSPASGAARGRTMLMDTVPALRAAGTAPDDVAQVVLTHAHYDHIGGLPAFTGTAAEVLMTRDEYDFWTGPMGRRGQFAHTTEASELDHLRELREAGRLTLAGPAYQIAPGIELIQVGGHTPGQAIVTVTTAGGQVILASDAVHYYEELERDWPFSTVASLAEMYAAFDQIRELASGPGASVVAGHDPLVAERFGDPADAPDVITLSHGRSRSANTTRLTPGRWPNHDDVTP